MPGVNRLNRVKASLALGIALMVPGISWSAPAVDQFGYESPAVEYSYTESVHNALLAHYANWEGTRHRLGGTTTKGIDCSSFIQILFQDKFQMNLPRSSREQMTMGERVDSSELRSGDLLFFRTGPTRRHVGVYMGNNQFMHVSTVAGVEIAKLVSPYWQRNFITARRVGLNSFIPSN